MVISENRELPIDVVVNVWFRIPDYDVAFDRRAECENSLVRMGCLLKFWNSSFVDTAPVIKANN